VANILFADVATEVAKTEDGDERLGAAVEAYRSAIEILDVERPRDDAGVFDSYTKIGDIRMQQGDLGKAIQFYRGAFEIARAMAEKSPQSTEWTSKAEQLDRKIQDLLTKPAQESPASNRAGP
jgi:hypothetical protein